MRRLLLSLVLAVVALLPGAMQAQAGAGQGRRDTLERDVRRALAARVQRVLGATDEQMRRLAPINRKYETERRAMLVEERGVRRELREALAAADADQPRIGTLLDRLFALQRRRLELVEQEQRELAGVLTPSQRARYLVLQEQLRRRIEDLREQRGPGRRGGREPRR